MRVLYIAPYSDGSTSKMRGEYLKDLLPYTEFKIIDTDIPFNNTIQPFRSLGWKFKKGPLVKNISNHILTELNGDYAFDLVWIDKGVFIKPGVVEKIREHSKKMVHYTPDPAFTFHQSDLFYKALPYYDYCVTTKSFELESYKKYGVKTIFCTQGYDPLVHQPFNTFQQKNGVIFIGHMEDERERIIAKLLEENITVTLAGMKWEKFAEKNKNKEQLIYKGTGIYGDEYAKAISGALMGLGFLSKWIPEMHTTRTLEIPACKTALVTERNEEITSIYSNDEAIYFDGHKDLVEKIKHYSVKKDELQTITEKGFQKVTTGGYSYYEILKSVISKII